MAELNKQGSTGKLHDILGKQNRINTLQVTLIYGITEGRSQYMAEEVQKLDKTQVQ